MESMWRRLLRMIGRRFLISYYSASFRRSLLRKGRCPSSTSRPDDGIYFFWILGWGEGKRFRRHFRLSDGQNLKTKQFSDLRNGIFHARVIRLVELPQERRRRWYYYMVMYSIVYVCLIRVPVKSIGVVCWNLWYSWFFKFVLTLLNLLFRWLRKE